MLSDTRPRGGLLTKSDLERDQELVARCQDGDAEAFATLYELHYPRLVRFCRRRLVNRHEAEDAAQDAFVRAWRAIDTLEPGSSFYPWLSVIAANRCTDLARKNGRSEPVADVPLPTTWVADDSVGDHLERREDAATAGAAVRRLSARHQRVLHLREELGLSVAEIAMVEGTTPNATDTLLWRARAALQREYRALLDGAAGLLVVGSMRFMRFGRRILHPMAQTTEATGGHGLAPWAAPIAFAATLSVAGGVLVTHTGSATPPPTRAPAVSGATGVSRAPAASRASDHNAATQSGSPSSQPASTGSSASTSSSGASGGSGTTGGTGAPATSGPVTSPAGGAGGLSGGAGSVVAGAGGAASNAAGGIGSVANSAAGAAGNVLNGAGTTASNALGGVAGTAKSLTNGLPTSLPGTGTGTGSSSTSSGGLLPQAGNAASTIASGAGSALSGTTQNLTGTLGQLGSGTPPALP